MAQHPGLGSLMTKVLARPFAGTPRIHKPHITEGKNKERNSKIKQLVLIDTDRKLSSISTTVTEYTSFQQHL